jgi:hypothetical protein
MIECKAVVAQKQSKRKADVLVRRLQSEGLGAAACMQDQLPARIAQGMRAGEVTFRQVMDKRRASPVSFTVGELVEVTASMEELVVMSTDHGGWSERMASTCGKVGRVKHVDGKGDVQVEFGCGTKFHFNPAALASNCEERVSDVLSVDFSEDEEARYGQLGDGRGRQFEVPDLAREQILQNNMLFSVTLPAAVRLGPKGFSTQWKRLDEEILPKLKKLGWDIHRVIASMRAGDTDAAALTEWLDDANVRAVVEHVQIVCARLKEDGRYFNVSSKVQECLDVWTWLKVHSFPLLARCCQGLFQTVLESVLPTACYS